MSMRIDIKTAISRYPKLFFILALLLVAFVYNYHHLLFERPQSVHRWCQSDCASLALNYYQNGMNFFEPQTHNYTSDNGLSCKSAPSEIPLLYYSVAIFYNIFGYHEWIYRLLNTLLFFLGLFYLFRWFYYILKDNFWAITLTLFFFSAPVLVYYGNNFLTNTSALAFAIAGWYYITKYSYEKHQKWLYYSLFFFFLAGAFKVTALFSLIAISGLLVLELLGLIRSDKNKPLFQKHVATLALISIVFLVIFSWIFYARWYNIRYQSTYFSTTIFPIWDLTSEGIQMVIRNVKGIWLEQYFHYSAFIFIALSTLFLFLNIRIGNKLFFRTVIILFFGIIVFALLQFYAFRDHDYFIIDFYILPILILLCVFEILKKHYPKWFNSSLFKIFFLFLLIFNINHAKNKQEDRYTKMNQNKMENLFSIEQQLRSMGIKSNDKVIYVPDGSHASLYLMNQPGWTEYTDTQYERWEKIRYNQDSTGIALSIDRGAKYLIVNGQKELYLQEYLQPFCNHLTGIFENIFIFDLKDTLANYHLPPLHIKQHITCNAEQLDSGKEGFLSNIDSVTFGNGNTQTSDVVLNGNYSIKLDKENPYGFTLKMKDVLEGESFSITVWKKSEQKNDGVIIASATDAILFYNSDSNIIEGNASGWVKIEKHFFITQQLPNNELIIYAYKNNNSPVYFDNIEIIRYETINSL